MEYHVTREGVKIKISDLEQSHLINIIKYIERKSENGVRIRSGGGFDAEDMWYDEYTATGEIAKRHLNYYAYKEELEKRKQLREVK